MRHTRKTLGTKTQTSTNDEDEKIKGMTKGTNFDSKYS